MKVAESTIIVLLPLAPALCAQQPPHAETPRGPGFVLRQDLPPMDGSKLNLSVLELEYRPGGSTDKHFHGGPVFVYVLEGEIVGKAGGRLFSSQSFYEATEKQ